MENAVQEKIRRDKELHSAFEQSQMAGDLLLKNEGRELRQIHQFANDLIKREYRSFFFLYSEMTEFKSDKIAVCASKME